MQERNGGGYGTAQIIDRIYMRLYPTKIIICGIIHPNIS